ncbi:hypothetical protein C1645_839946 [Glomus cerebriforme]|uniref:Uncharacterized protein n=1 Tax=Glomus cerebriforme TaxID=658196 RepID=A0A397S018_9GLOM|nr:hypothetical protein C1645_839946 [Glomus cerebriforme]
MTNNLFINKKIYDQSFYSSPSSPLNKGLVNTPNLVYHSATLLDKIAFDGTTNPKFPNTPSGSTKQTAAISENQKSSSNVTVIIGLSIKLAVTGLVVVAVLSIFYKYAETQNVSGNNELI